MTRLDVPEGSQEADFEGQWASWGRILTAPAVCDEWYASLRLFGVRHLFVVGRVNWQRAEPKWFVRSAAWKAG